MTVNDVVFKGLMAFASVSLGINSFFVKETVAEMKADTGGIRADFKELSKSLQDVRVDMAVKDAILNNVRSRVEICEARLDKAEEKVHLLEVARGR